MQRINRWHNIQLIISDFDGVMTDNRVLIDENGKESVFVSRADGQGIHILRSLNIELVILSTEANTVVSKRAEKLGVECIQNVGNKAERLKSYSKERNIALENICYVGNDINDYEAMCLAGIKVVPDDAYEVVKKNADYITTAKGGYGVIREIADWVLHSKNGDIGLKNQSEERR